MTEFDLYSHFRRLIGEPTKEEVSNRMLRDHLIPAFDWLASKIQYLVKEDDFAIHLVADQIEFVLPCDLLWIIWISWNGNRLTPSSQYRWDRDESNFRIAASATPNEYATQGNLLLMFPPPSASAIVTAGYLKMRYIATPSHLESSGPIEMYDADQWLALYKGAIRYLIAHPTPENQQRIEGYKEQVAELLGMAISRNTWQIQQYEPVIRPYTERGGAAR
jgi:hypothetical protein